MLKRFLKYIIFSFKCIGKNVSLAFPVSISLRSVFEGNNRIERGSAVYGNIGRGSYISVHSCLEADIGRYCSIAWNVSTVCGRHPLEKFVSTHPMFFSKNKQCGMTLVEENCFDEYLYADPQKKIHVVIENDVWIGAFVKIIGGVTIHNGAVVLAGAVVTKDVPPYAIVGGIPAKILRYRFDDETIRNLLKFQWWNKSEEWLKKHLTEMQDIEKLKILMEKENLQ